MTAAISGSPCAVAAQAAAQAQASPPAASTAAASTSNRATAQDTVSISPAGQRLSSAPTGNDGDGDAH